MLTNDFFFASEQRNTSGKKNLWHPGLPIVASFADILLARHVIFGEERMRDEPRVSAKEAKGYPPV